MVRLFRTPPFPTVFAVGLFQEIAFFLLVNLPGRLQQLGISESGIGVAYSLSALAALLLRPLLGRTLDVVHRRTVLRVAGVLNIIGIVVLALVDVVGPLLWVAFLSQRVLQIFLFTTILAYAADSIPVDIRTLGLAIFGLSGLIPITVANLMGDPLLNRLGYEGVIGTAAVAAVISWTLVWRLPLLPVLGRRPRRNFWSVVAQRNLLPVWWITLMFALATEAAFVFIRPFVNARRIGTLGLFFVVYGTFAIVTRLAGGRLATFSPRRVTVIGVATQGVGTVLLGTAASLPVLLAAAALMGAAHGTVFPLLSTQVVNRARTAERGSAVSVFTALLDVGLLVVAPVVGAIIEAADYDVAFGSVGAVVAVGAVVYLLWDRRVEAEQVAGAR